MPELVETEGFTLQERMHLSLNKFTKVMGILLIILIFPFIFSAIGIWSANEINLDLENSGIDPSSDIFDDVYRVFMASVITVAVIVSIMIWYGVRGSKILKELDELNKQFIRQSYLQNLETSVARGKDRSEKIINQLVAVFPEVKEAKIKAEGDEEEFYSTNKKIGDYTYSIDLPLDNRTKILLVKFFDHKLQFDDLELLVKNVKKSFEKTSPFRVICIATEYDEIFKKDELIEKMEELDIKFKLDLIIEDEKGYSIIWID